MVAETPTIVEVLELYNVPEVEGLLTKAVNSWVRESFGSLNQVQQIAIPRIIQRQHTLVMAPTGSGKTLAAFLGIISELHKLESNNKLEEKIYALYVSPLKALNNDIHKNLEVPLDEIRSKTGSHITAAKRTGDTTTKERQRLLRKPPHILITTPESLGLMLAAPKFKQRLRDLKWLIIDEIHSIADNKRGTHLALSIERLEYYLGHNLTRIGLSATIEPPELVGHYLVGARDVNLGIVDRGGLRKLNIDVITPTRNLVRAPFSLIQQRQLELLKTYVANHKTVLIFTNTRHMAERLSVDLIEMMDDEYKDKIAVHHGSLDKDVRLEVENRLKDGQMRAVFSSTSLEMGIDIGSIDLTVQLGSPKTVRSLLQRIGRSGHSQDLVSQGKVLVFGRDDLLECVVIAKLAIEGEIDAIRIPEAPTDVLIQVLIGMAIEQKWDIIEAYAVIKRAYPYREMSYESFIKILDIAADPTGNEDSWKYGHIWIDHEIKKFGRRKSARQSYLQNIGTIPDSTTIDVVLRGFRNTIGQISEKFAEKLQQRDIFVLGGKPFEFIRSVGEKILVEAAPGRIPTIPSWGGEALTRTLEVSQGLNHLLEGVAKLLVKRQEAIEWIISNYPTNSEGAETIVDYITEQLSMTPLPQLNRIITEVYLDPSGYSNILILSIYGLETNQALAQALGRVIAEEMQTNIGTLAMDNGLLLRIPPGLNLDVSNLFDRLKGRDLKLLIISALRGTEMFRTRFRHAAGRSLMIVRKWGKRSIAVSQQQRTASWLLKTLGEEMPVVQEAYREILYDVYNLKQAELVVDLISSGDVTVHFKPGNDIPSSFTHAILFNGELDVVVMEDKRTLLASLHQQVLARLLPELSEFDSIFERDKVDHYFSLKFDEKIPLQHRLLRIVEYPGKDQIQFAIDILGLSEVKIRELIKKLDDAVVFQGRYTTYSMLPMIAVTRDLSFWNVVIGEHDAISLAQQLAKDISPEAGWELLILKILELRGPLSLQQISKLLDVDEERIIPILLRLQRHNKLLKGVFTGEDDQFLRIEDRNQMQRSFVQNDLINEDRLKNFRLYQMRLVQRNRSIKMTVLDYLRENGPARDPIELVSRLDEFRWTELRAALLSKDVYFGRFLGKRLVFIHHQDLEDFIIITRDPLHKHTELSSRVLEMIAERPGITQRDLSRMSKLTSSQIGEILRELEDQLFISRIGFELTLTHGGFPNPRYIPLPEIEYTKDRYLQSVISIIERCCHWYGPLTLNDLLRVTRLSYPALEQGLGETQLMTKMIMGVLHYGHDYSFQTLEDLKIRQDELDEIFLLSPLDPYFYMTSGSFRRDYLPRQTRLTILHEGLPRGYIELAIPDKDILQVINLQINQRDVKNFRLLKNLGYQLRRLGRVAYETPVIYIEEIRYKPANHIENSVVVTTLQEIDYQLQYDVLVSGTGLKHRFSMEDIYATRQINRKLMTVKKFQDLEALFAALPVVTEEQILIMMDIDLKNLRLLLSHQLRKGIIHYHKGRLYSDELFASILPIKNTSDEFLTLPVYQSMKNPKTRSEIVKELDLKVEEVTNQLSQLLDANLIELISPYSKVREYRQLHGKKISLKRRLDLVTSHLIATWGPISFSELLEKINNSINDLKITRSQLLVTLGTLFEKQLLSSAAIGIDDKLREIMYFTPSQAKILGDPDKNRYFQGWEVYSIDDEIFDVNTMDTHVLVSEGKLVASFAFKRDGDTGIVENLNLIKYDIEFDGMIKQLEDFIFNQGLIKLKINHLGGAIPLYWMDLV